MRNLLLPAWQPNEEAMLLSLRKQNLSARQISLQIPGKSRNAVIGKLHRLGLSSPRTKTGQGLRKKKIKINVEAIKKFIVDKNIFDVIDANSVKLLDASAHHCRWPLGLKNDFCCGLQKEINEYCIGHALVAYENLKNPV